MTIIYINPFKYILITCWLALVFVNMYFPACYSAPLTLTNNASKRAHVVQFVLLGIKMRNKINLQLNLTNRISLLVKIHFLKTIYCSCSEHSIHVWKTTNYSCITSSWKETSPFPTANGIRILLLNFIKMTYKYQQL